jgi:flagellar basal body P-ring formation protein FlgA
MTGLFKFFLCAWIFFLPNAFALEVLVKEEARVQGDTLYLGDIASFTPPDDGRVKMLKEVEVGASPAPGRSMSLSNRFLIYRIGPSLSNMDDVRVKVPESLLVHREAQTIGVESLKKIYREHVLKNSPFQADRVRFEQINVPGPVLLPVGSVRWEVKNRGGDAYVGDFSIVISFYTDGKPARKIPLTGRISVKQEVLKTTRKINTGEVIGREDVVVIEERDLRIRENVLTDLDQVVGKRASRSLQEGQLLTSRMIEEPPLVQKGDRVVIGAENQRIRITAWGRALEDGRGGEQVKVVNMSSGREIFGTVVSPGHVSVSF